MDMLSLPKAELHCHLDGVLDPAMLAQILVEYPDFPIRPEWASQVYPVNGLESFWNWWHFVEPIWGRFELFHPILKFHIKRLIPQNVRYVELMIPYGTLPRETKEAITAMISLRELADQLENQSIQIEFLIGIGRNHPPEVIHQRVQVVLLLFREKLISGVSLAGVEQGYPVKPLHQSFVLLHEAAIPIEIHAGEWCGPESVWDALEFGFPSRIGHGVSLFKDPELIDIFQERRIHIEICPTSNVKTGSVSCLEEHPILQARDLGMNFSVNTDDPGPFECSLASEYQLLHEVFGFGEADFGIIYQNALQSRFQPRLRLGPFT